MALSSSIAPPLGPGDAVLFDMDGTLLFLPVDIEALRERLGAFHRRYGIEMAFRPLTDDLGRAARRLEKLLSPAEARAAVRWARAQVEQAEVDAAARVRPREGVLGAMRILLSRGVHVGVVSNNTRRGIRAALEAAGVELDALEALVSREDVPHPKPAPDGIELALRLMTAAGWSPARAEDDGDTPAPRWLYVGDGPSDVMAAAACRRARIHPRLARGTIVVVGGGLAGAGHLAGPGADVVLPDDVEASCWLLGDRGERGAGGPG